MQCWKFGMLFVSGAMCMQGSEQEAERKKLVEIASSLAEDASDHSVAVSQIDKQLQAWAMWQKM